MNQPQLPREVAQGEDRLRRRRQRAPGPRPVRDRPASAASTSAAPVKRPPVRHHYGECDTVLYDGGACSQITLNGITVLSPPPVVGPAQGQFDAVRELRLEWA